MTAPPVKLSASQVSLILQRAAEIDARGDTLTVDELRRIAAEAGIDAGATNTAIAEIMTGEEPAPVPAVPNSPKAPAKTSPFPSSLRILTGGAVGVVLGFLASVGDVEATLGFGAAVMYLLIRAVQSMRRGSQFDFQLQNFALWFGGMVAVLATGFFPEVELFTGRLPRVVPLLDSGRAAGAVWSGGGGSGGGTAAELGRGVGRELKSTPGITALRLFGIVFEPPPVTTDDCCVLSERGWPRRRRRRPSHPTTMSPAPIQPIPAALRDSSGRRPNGTPRLEEWHSRPRQASASAAGCCPRWTFRTRPRKEDRQPGQESRIAQPVEAVLADMRDEPGIDIGVDHIEEEA